MTKSKKRFWEVNPNSSQTKFPGRIISIEERFAGIINRYVTKRKALAKDREGIRIEISAFNSGNLTLTHNKNKGQYSVEVLTSQLINNNNTLKFKCTLYNDRKQSISLTAASLLDACSLTLCYDDKNDWMKRNKFIKIEPKRTYSHVIIKFHIDEPVICSYEIPIALNFKSEIAECDITLCRTILLRILDSKEKTTSKGKEISPFTGNPFFYKYLIRKTEQIKTKEHGPKPHENEFTGLEYNVEEILEALSEIPDAKRTTLENYAEKFHNCLWLEEITNRKMLEKFNMEDVTMTLEGKRLKLKVPGLEQKRPGLVIGDKIHIAPHKDHTAYVGTIIDIDYCYVIIENIDDELLTTISDCPTLDLDVSFQLGELPLERAHQGIKEVFNRGMVKSLFNITKKRSTKLSTRKITRFYNRAIINNQEQRTAVENILNCTSGSAPYIVYGPPGTGKTVTIVEAIYQIFKHTSKKILVCAPSNAACDMLTEKLIQFCRTDELIRIHSKSRDKSMIPEKIQPYSNFSGEDGVFSMDCGKLLSFRIIVTTLILIGKYSDRSMYMKNTVYEADCVFIDEAAQASEPDACVALAMLKSNGNIVLAGDPKQLGPIILSTYAQEYGLDISLLERLMNTDRRYKDENPEFITMLKNNFRSHADILYLPNKLFYNSKLKAVSEKAQNHPVSRLDVYSNIKILQAAMKTGKNRYQIPGRAVEFIGVSSTELREGQSPSYYNEAEAIMVIECVRTLMEPNFIGGINLCDIGVISPYIRQVYKIKELLQLNKFKDVEVGSTEAFQGREKLVIIISTVRAQHDLLMNRDDYNLGFVKDERRFNVALTRAMSKLIVIGCPAVLSTDSKWREFIEECRNMRTYHGFPLEERNKGTMINIIGSFQKYPVFMSDGVCYPRKKIYTYSLD